VEVPSKTSPPAAQQVAPEDKPYFQAYRRADPITQWPLKKVLHQFPELKGLKPATDQSRLPEVLRGVSANLQKFVVNFIDTTSVENIDEAETPPYWGQFEPYAPERSTKRIRQKFDYLILRHQKGGDFTLDEYRTDLHGQKEHPQKRSKDSIKTAGFAAMPLFFGPLQQPWSDFSYLGRQTIGGINTQVVAFAEHVDPAAVMGHFVLAEISIPLLVQGVAWIRPGDYQIVQMRTDLLAPLPPLKRMTAVVHFAGFQFQDIPAALWLPKEVEVKVDFEGYAFSNRHRYSNYRMFRVTVIQKQPPVNQQH
jgi:hypothetical protein